MAAGSNTNLPKTPPPADRPAPLSYRAAPPRTSRTARGMQKVREFMRPDHLREFGSTLALVAPLTVLIWVWAEREQTVGSKESPEKQTFQIAVRSGGVGQSVALAQGQGDSILVGFTGPKVGLDAMKESMLRDASKRRLVIDVGDTFEPGQPYPVPIDAALNQQKIFRDNGLTVVSAEPSVVQVFVDRQVERDVPVRLPPELTDAVAQATFEPKTVKVRGPERTIKQLEANGALKAELDVSNLAELRNRPGAKVELPQVPLRPIEGASTVSFDTSSIAKVTLQLSQEEQGELRSVVVFVSKPAGLNVTTTVTPLVLTGVKVTGPSEALRLLREEKVTPAPSAVLTITLDDKGTHEGTRVPTIVNLPPGVRVIPASVSPVTFDVLESSAATDERSIP